MSESSKVMELLLDHAGIVHKLSFMYSNTKEEYEDLRQEIIYQLVKSYENFKGDSKLSTWVYKVSLFTALAFLRKKPGKVTSLSHDIILEDESADNSDWDLVMEELKKLPEIDKTLIFLYLEDKSYQEMAEIMGLSESNIGVKLNRIKKKLKENIKANYGT